MNVPDLRNVDFDGYERRARELQTQAIDASIDRAVAWIKALLHRRHDAALTTAAHAAS